VDALVAAALLARAGWEASALLVERDALPAFPAVQEQLALVSVIDEMPAGVSAVLDGIFGNSGRTDLPKSATAAIRSINMAREHCATVYAVDCPTGTNTLTGEIASEAVHADVTLCISNPKIGMLKPPAVNLLGDLVVLDIGLPALESDSDVNAVQIDGATVATALPRRDATAHKADIGGVLIVGGAPGYYGAPRLAGEAALRTGAGYVGLAVPRSIVGAIASQVPEIIFHPTPDGDGRRSAEAVRKAIDEGERYRAVVIGPGLGRDEVAKALLNDVLARHAPEPEVENRSPAFGIPRRARHAEAKEESRLAELPVVIDADGLNWLSEQENWPEMLSELRCVLTPHHGEMARLLGKDIGEVSDDPWETARSAAAEWGQIVVLKGGFTCVATPDGDVLVSPRATPELATPGTGDALAGMIGSLLAQGCEPREAAISAVYIGALAGRHAAERQGARSVIARDLIDAISGVIADIDSPARARRLGSQP
jgi:NAD(P)H-hydrate epimerase